MNRYLTHSLKGLTGLALILFTNNVSAQWNEQSSFYDDPTTEIFGISVPEEDVIWTLIEQSTWAEFQRVYGLSTDGGESFTYAEIDSLPTFVGLKVKGIDESTAFASLITFPEEDSSRIYKTTDGGSTWNFIPSAFNGPYEACIDIHFFDENNGVGFGAPILGPLTIYTTNDGGDNWEKVAEENMPTPLVNEGMLIYTGNGSYGASGNTLWFGTTKGRIYKTTDQGNNWVAHEIDTNYTIHTVDFKDELNGVAVSLREDLASGPTKNRIYVTTDGGETWNLANNYPELYPRISVVNYLPGSENTYVSTHGRPTGKGVMISYDGGMNWMVINTERIGAAEFLSETYGWGGGLTSTTENGLFKWSGEELGLNSEVQNSAIIYPTVTSDIIRIVNSEKLTTDHAKCYSLNGKVINLQINQNTIDVSHLDNGIYLLLIQTDSGAVTEKFVKK